MTILRAAKIALVTVFLAGCTTPNLESAFFGEKAQLRSKIMAFYARNAREERGRCNRPYIDNTTKVDVLEDTAERWVAEVRYRYLDRIRDEEPGSDRKACFGFASRTFTLAPVDGVVVVTEMSGTDCAGSLFSLNRALGLGRRTRTCP